MRNEQYFCLHLTENEHYIVEDMLRAFCNSNGLSVVYYRKLKNGHVPMYRECKITGNIGLLRGFLEKEKIIDNIEPFPEQGWKC